MKNFITRLLVLVPGLIWFNCKGLDDEKIIGQYYLVDIDYDQDSRTLSYKLKDGNFVGLIAETVFAAGNNENYIIAKQHPRTFAEPPNKAVTNYFIVPINKESTQRPENGILGPMSLKEFNKRRHELNIGDEVGFTKTLDGME